MACQVIVMAVAFVWWIPRAGAQVETFDYTVEQGDTCESIADEFYEHDGGCDLIKKYNSEAGGEPDFTPGNVLQLPTKVAKPEAEVDHRHGPVRAREPDRDWRDASVGQELFRSWRVNTLEAARAQLGFRDRSELKMRENTLVIIYGGSRQKAKRKRSRAHLEQGKLRSKLADLSGGSLEVETPSAKAETGQTTGFFDVDEEGTTRVANHGGESIEVSGKGSNAAGQSVTVREGMGTKVEKGRPPSPPEELPPAPEWTTAKRDVLSLGGESVDVSAEWESVDEAAQYFVELAADRRGIETVKSAYVSADVTRLEVEELPPGTYYATVSSIDSDEFEGIPSERIELRVLPVEHETAARVEGEEVPTFVLGTRLGTPGGVRCTDSEGEPEASVQLGTPGERTLRCVTEEGGEVRPRTIRVAEPEIELGGPDFEEGRVRVRRTGFGVVDMSFDPRAPDDLEVAVEAGGGEGLSVGATPVTRQRWRIKIDAGESTVDEAELIVRAGDDLELARIPVDIERAEERSRTQRRREVDVGGNRAVRLGLQGGGVGHVGGRSDRVQWGGAGRLVLSYLHDGTFGVEIFGGGEWSQGDRMGAIGRVRGLGRFGSRDLRPYAAGGFGLSAPIGRVTRPFLAASAGVEYRLGPIWAVRGEGGTDLAFDPEGEASWSPRVDVGLLMRFP